MRQGLLLIVIVALLPVVFAGLIQGMAAFQSDPQSGDATGSGGNASAVAEREPGTLL